MSVTFQRGQQLGRNDLNIFLTNSSGHPTNAAEIYYSLIDFTTGSEVVVGSQKRQPANPSVGEYFASIVVPLDARLGEYRIRWYFREMVGAMLQSVVQEFEVVERGMVGKPMTTTAIVTDLIRRFRILLRDWNPDKHYHFRPPTHEETVNQYNRVFGFIWEDNELEEYLERGLDMVVATPPRTPFASIDDLVKYRREWTTMLLTGAMMHALQALRLNWIADEFDYSIGGISLNLDKSSKYESALQYASDQFDKQIEKAKMTVKIIKGLQQPRYGVGIRSSFGPFAGRGVLSPRRFMGV